MLKAIIFDFAGVVGADGYWIWLKENIKDLDKVRKDFHDISEKVDRGEIRGKEFVEFISQKSGKDSSTIWPQIYERIKINYELLGLIKELKVKYKIGLLSNFIYEWLEEVLTNHKLYEYFDEVIISSKHGVIKPEPEIFHKMLARLGVREKEAVFIDDRLYNVEGASKLGINALLFENNEKLKEDLKDLESALKF